LAATDLVYPQFATHNALTLATLHAMAGPDFRPGLYEFQCLHGMGEGLYQEVVGKDKLDRPCRIYAPVGSHETLLAYLVRRLLENGANTSFVNRIADPAVGIESLVVDPVALAERTKGAPHLAIPLPQALFPERRNSQGVDLTDDVALRGLDAALRVLPVGYEAMPMLGADDAAAQSAGPIEAGDGAPRPALVPTAIAPDAIAPGGEIRNPADYTDPVGTVIEAAPDEVERAVAIARAQGSAWSAVSASRR